MKPSGEKESRIKSTLQPRYSGGVMYHEANGNNVKELELELIKFPNGKHDDMIDALASCVAMANIESTNNNETPRESKHEMDILVFGDDDEEKEIDEQLLDTAY